MLSLHDSQSSLQDDGRSHLAGWFMYSCVFQSESIVTSYVPSNPLNETFSYFNSMFLDILEIDFYVFKCSYFVIIINIIHFISGA